MKLISVMRSAMTAVVALAMLLVSCEKEPVAETSNITIYVDELEAKPEGESLRVNFSIAQPIEGVSLDVK